MDWEYSKARERGDMQRSPTDTGWHNTPPAEESTHTQPGNARFFIQGGLVHRIWTYPHPENPTKFFVSHTTYDPTSRTLTEYHKTVPGSGPFNAGAHGRDTYKRIRGGQTSPLPGFKFTNRSQISEELAKKMFPHHFIEPKKPIQGIPPTPIPFPSYSERNYEETQ